MDKELGIMTNILVEELRSTRKQIIDLNKEMSEMRADLSALKARVGIYASMAGFVAGCLPLILKFIKL